VVSGAAGLTLARVFASSLGVQVSPTAADEALVILKRYVCQNNNSVINKYWYIHLLEACVIGQVESKTLISLNFIFL
jgi:hypothetical protein